MDVGSFASNLLGLAQSTFIRVIDKASEPVWMRVWGVALLMVASGARALMLGRLSDDVRGGVSAADGIRASVSLLSSGKRP